jgi:phospholipase/carboxylesterase
MPGHCALTVPLTAMPGLDGLAHELRPAAGEPEGVLVLLHGRGTSEQDVLPLLEVLDPERRFVGACPRGPLELPPMGHHWYVVPRVGFPDPDTFRASYAALADWLDALAAHTGVAPERTILGGFSQGTVMAWAMGLGPDRPLPAGILAISGFVPTVEGWEPDRSRLDGLPVAIAHGSEDPIIPVDFGRAARDLATEAGAEVLYRENRVAHFIDPNVVGDLAAWVQARRASAPLA